MEGSNLHGYKTLTSVIFVSFLNKTGKSCARGGSTMVKQMHRHSKVKDLSPAPGYNDTQNNDIQHNDIQHNDIQHNDIQHKYSA
jgi:hypothetical protein